ncbi:MULTISPECIES: type II secretion system protein [Gemella]|uniref:type II secretion system protein n=1 Tax=Gemella TaxID=1378 RepID=UPI001E3CD235|nr:MULTISPECIES: type II secretion system protein [Gemella]
MAKKLLFQMEKLHYKTKEAYTLVEMLAVLLIVSIIVIMLSVISIGDYTKYKERLAVNELISDIYFIQTSSLREGNSPYIDLFSGDNEYLMYYDKHSSWKKLSQNGKIVANGPTIRLRYREGNLISRANTIDVKFERSLYRIIVHLDSGYITVDEL